MEYAELLSLPKDRVGVLIGEGGKVKRNIEEIANVKIKIDSDGNVDIIRDEESNIEMFMKAREVVRAIGCGFSAEKAMKLFKDDIYLEVLDLEDYAKPQALKRQIARIIGTEGKTKKKIEQTTTTDVSVYGRYVGVIGELQWVHLALEAIMKLLEGSPHAKVYAFLERNARNMELG